MYYLLFILLLVMLVSILPQLFVFGVGVWAVVTVIRVIKYLINPNASTTRQRTYYQSGSQDRTSRSQSQSRNKDVIDVEYTEREVKDDSE